MLDIAVPTINFNLGGKQVEKFLSVAQVAKRLKVTPRSVLRWMAEGRFPGYFQANPEVKNSPFLIPESSVAAFEKTRPDKEE